MINDNQICQKDFEDIKHIFVTAGLISTKGKLTCISLKIHHHYSLAKAIVINIALCLNQVKEPALSGLCCALVQANFIVIKPYSGFSQWKKRFVSMVIQCGQFALYAKRIASSFASQHELWTFASVLSAIPHTPLHYMQMWICFVLLLWLVWVFWNRVPFSGARGTIWKKQ